MQSSSMGRFKRLFINTILFAVGQFGSTIVSFLLVPIYTHHLSTAEYGTADLVINLTNLLLPLISICITDGVIKFSLDGEHDFRQVFTNSTLVCAIGVVVALCLFPVINLYGKIGSYILIFYLILVTRVFYNLILAFIKSLQRLKLYSIIAVSNTLISCVTNILLLVVFRLGVTGYLLSYVISNTLSIVVSLLTVKLWHYVKPCFFSRNTLKEMTLFSIPLIPNNFSNWAMNSMDKYMLTYMLDVSYNGLYSIAHKLPAVISMFSAVFNQAWNFSALEEQRNKDYQGYYKKVFILYSSYMFMIASAVLCVVKPIMLIWVSEEFSIAWKFTPYLFISTIFSCLTGFYVPLFVIAKKTNKLFISTAIGTIVNLILNYILIKLWDINGASLATVITYLVVWIIRGRLIEQYIDIRLDKKKAFINAGLLLLQATFLIFSHELWYIVQICFLLVVLLFNRNEITTLFSYVKGVYKKLNRRDDVT